jgi:hypothetical protein
LIGDTETPWNIPEQDSGWFELVSRPDYPQIERQIRDVGACENPVWLTGRTLVVAVATGAVVDSFTSENSPFGAIPIRCMNRRASRCTSCSRLYAGDAFQLVRAGLSGGKGVPDTVAAHPLVFATLTAPSFGPVHRKPDPRRSGDRCRPRRGGALCDHGRAPGCLARHEDTDKLIGQPLCPGCYDYPGHVLWNAHASALWKSFTDTVYRHLARVGGVPGSQVRTVLRVEYVRLTEYQARGLVHFHSALRLDGPDDRADDPPRWATAEVLADAVVSAARAVVVAAPISDEIGERRLGFGVQVDARPIVLGSADLPPERPAGYMAKYVTKGTEDASGVDVAIVDRWQIAATARTDHVRALMHASWDLGSLTAYRGLRLRGWTHMLGFGGHVLTCSRRYSVTLGTLRQTRADYRHGPAAPNIETIRDARWSYNGRGWQTPAIAEQAAGIREEIEQQRDLIRDLPDGLRAAGQAS